MALASSWRTEEMNRFVAVDEAELRQGKYAIPVEGRLEGEIEADKRLDRCEPSHSQGGLDAAVLAKCQFFGQEDIDSLKYRQLAVLKASNNMVESLQRPWHLQADEIVTDTIDHRWNGVEGRAHGRLSCARTLPMAS
jgi:hypothetical protein